jgi:hypothetical protein
MNSMHQAFTIDAMVLEIVWQLQKPNKIKLLVDLLLYLWFIMIIKKWRKIKNIMR